MKKSRFSPQNNEKWESVQPHHLPTIQKQPKKAAFEIFRHNSDTFSYNLRMRPPSQPKINKNDPKEYFIYWNHDVPMALWDHYPRRRMRIKINDNINYYKDQEREDYAELRLKVWHHRLFNENYNPFGEELLALERVKQQIQEVKEEIAELEAIIAESKEILTPEQLRKQTPISKALDLWIDSRKERTKNGNSVSTYRVTATWLTKYFESIGRHQDPVNSITRLEIATGLMIRKNERDWEATTYNNEYDTLINLFNWLELEEYIDKNPIVGRIKKIPTQKHKHKWYDPETKERVKKALVDAGEYLVLNVMQFTYEIMIRSKTELMKLKAGDIDRVLKRVHFSADLSKNGVEYYRDYSDEFGELLDRMNFDDIPKHYYVFGKNGEPSEFKCHKDLFADRWRVVRNSLGLSDDYTIYGMKHTRIVHELMKGTEGNMISYLARHEDPKSKSEYMRDYDLSLINVYGPEDLKF